MSAPVPSASSSDAAAPAAASAPPVVLPPRGQAKVKSVLSGDSVVLLGRAAAPNQPPPEVVFTLEAVSAPRLASKSTPQDEPGAFAAREWLRRLVVGKQVAFETKKQGTGNRVFGNLTFEDKEIALECVKAGHATPKAVKYGSATKEGGAEGAGDAGTEDATAAEEQSYEAKLLAAYHEAQEAGRGIHDTTNVPTVRLQKQAGADFATLALVEHCQKVANQKRLTCVVEYVFDGSRLRVQVVEPGPFQYGTVTLLLAGIMCPRIGNPKADPPTATEPFAVQARQFVEARLLQRELPIQFLGTDKSGMAAVGVVYHPAGNIAIELLKNGLARMADWSVRLMPVGDVPALRVAENNAKRAASGIWHDYAPPVLQSASHLSGTVVEVVSGDTLLVLPNGKLYDSEDALVKVSLASIRAPRAGAAATGRADEPYSFECKDRLRLLTIGKPVQITMHYERDIPIRPDVQEKRPFGTVSTEKHPDVAEVLVQEGLAVTQRHRDDDEKSPRYDELRAAEAAAKAASKGVHKEGEYKRGAINDLTDPRKAKTYSGSLQRAGTMKAVVDYVFNGALFKLYIPSENCYIRFAPNYVRCPQASPSPGSRQQGKPAEPFGDESKRHARLNTLQRLVEITVSTVTNSGILLGKMNVMRRDYSIELLGAGLARVDQLKIDYGEAPKDLIDAQDAARQNKVGIWSIEQQGPKEVKVVSSEKKKEEVLTVRLSEIRSGSHLYYTIVKDESAKVMDESLRLFTQERGTAGAPCDVKINKVVAALFDDGTGKRWYRAKIVERKGAGKVSVLFVDYGNIAVIPVSTHLRPLDVSLGTDRVPPVAKEAVLALTVTRSLDRDEGVDAARMLQSVCWGKDLTAHVFAQDENGKQALTLATEEGEATVNSELVSSGLARVAKPASVNFLSSQMVDSNSVVKLAADLNVAQETARKARAGMWRYGDVDEDDPDTL